jgi:hypothetical protein
MTAIYRISRFDTGVQPVSRRKKNDFRFYLDRLMKLIPGEVVGLYLTGTGIIPKDRLPVSFIWALVCLVAVILVKAYGTADVSRNIKPDWVHVSISVVSYLIWIYTIGGPFQEYTTPWIGSIMVITWTFFIPFIYKGPAT